MYRITLILLFVSSLCVAQTDLHTKIDLKVRKANPPQTKTAQVLDEMVDSLRLGGSGGGAVNAVFGRTGNVTAQANDYTFSQIGSKPTTITGYGITDAVLKTFTINGQALNGSSITILGNVDNTSDANKPVSTAQQTALDGKVPITRTINSQPLSADVTLTKSNIGLSNVDNTPDASKPVSTAQAAADALNLKIANNLSDGNASTMRTNLGLGTLSTQNGTAPSGAIVGTTDTQVLTNKTIAIGSNTITGTLPIANGGTGQTTANAALNALLPSQTGNNGKIISTDGTNASWTSPAGGGDALTTNPLSQFAATTSAQLRGVLSDEVGNGASYFVGGNFGTPAGGVVTNLTGTAPGVTAGNVTTNANSIGDVTSVGNTTTYNNRLPVAKGGTGYTNLVLPKYVPLFIFVGESNAGGFAVNSDATAGELAPRPQTRIYNPLTHTFQTLQIGVNNLINHTGLTNNASHGWELELANQLAQFDNDSIYIVKCGQGGSTIAQWSPGVSPYYYDTCINRVKTALALLKAQNKQPQIYILYSQGINDGAGTTANNWVSGTKTLIANLKKKLGNVPVLMTQLVGAGTTFTTRMQSDITKSFNNVYYIRTPQTAVGDSLRDVSHWSYIGMKKITQRMVTMIIDSVGVDYTYLRNMREGQFTLNNTIEALNSQPFIFKSATIEAMRLTSAGKVQVGGSTTAYGLLDVGISSGTASQVHVGKGADDGFWLLNNSAADTYLQSGNYFNGTNFIAKATTASVYNMGVNGSHIFDSNTGLTVGNTYTPTQRARIDATGLKIGTGTPSTALDVTGVATVSGNIITTGGFISSNQSANSTIYVYDRVTNTDYTAFYSSSDAAHMQSQAGDIMTWGLVTKYVNVPNRLGVNQASPTAYLHLGPGTTSPNTAPTKYTSGPLNTVAVSGQVEFNDLFYQTKASGLRYANGGTIADFYTDGANSSTTETDLYTYTTPVSTLATSGEKLIAQFTAISSDVTASSDYKLYFGGTSIYDSGVLGTTTGTFVFNVTIVRTGTSTARAIVSVIQNITAGTSGPPSTETDLTGLTFTNTNIVKLTGQAGGATGGSGDLTAKIGYINWFGAANN